ncbi:hypothetical protein [Skermanella pratensis]|uniref:hypothetical protein n=1 Tax=Skermanella pratensis TaxID=2233999 RepID=UPI00130157F6|nr:hypothetical protein [Skermanella pratensis]
MRRESIHGMEHGGNSGAWAVNSRLPGAWSWREARPVVLHPMFYRGYQDFQTGMPFDYRILDGLESLDQIRYENGREIAAECRALGLSIRWPDRNRVPRELKAVVVDRAWARRAVTCPQIPVPNYPV